MASQQRKRININLLIPFLIIAVVFGTMIWQKYRNSREIPAAPQLQPPVGKRTAVLFFVADGSRLAREARELDPCEDVVVCLKDVLEELLNGPVGEFDESLPEGTVINMVRIEGDRVAIDLNRAFADALPSGSSAEMLAVYSIVNTVAVNFPQVTKIKLTVEGNEKTILRHLDLSDPLTPDFTLEQLPQPDTATVPAATPSKTHKGR